MTASEFNDIFGDRIELTDERRDHILSRHPEVSAYFNKIPEALSKPDVIIKSRLKESTKLYHKKYGDHYLVIVVNEGKEFYNNGLPLEPHKDRRCRMAKGMSFYYDKEGDVLDISVEESREAISEEISEDFFVRKDPKTNEIVGFMILNFENRFKKLGQKETIPIKAVFNIVT